jgi:uncharacterized OB-fold protein
MADPPAAPPLPVPDELTQPFWDAVGRRTLAIQRCTACRTYIHPPAALCEACRTSALEFVEVSGRGRVHSYTLVRDQRLPVFDGRTPYVVGKVALEEQADILLTTNFPGSAFADLRCGQPARVEFEEVAPGRLIPQFRVVRD